MVEKTQGANDSGFMKVTEVSDLVNISVSSIWERVKPDSPRYDPNFPHPYRTGPRSTRWKRSEIETWCASRPQTNDKSVGNVPSSVGPKEATISAPRNREEKLGKETVESIKNDIERKRVTFVRELLEVQAKRGERLFYEDVMARVMLSPNDPADCKAIDRILEDISKAFHSEHNVLISALVHEAYTGKKRPKQAFFEFAKSLGYTYDDPEVFVEQQIIKLYELYEDLAAKSKGKLIRMKIGNKSFLTRRG